jgi:small subunit ribosomal protein S18
MMFRRKTDLKKAKKKPKWLTGRRKKACRFCFEKVEKIDYKDVGVLRKFLSDRGKIFPRRTSAICAKHQRQLAMAIKRARYMALLPYVVE